MSCNSDKAADVANKAMARQSKVLATWVGLDRMKADGVMQELKVDAQKTTGDAKNATKESVDKTAAALKKPF